MRSAALPVWTSCGSGSHGEQQPVATEPRCRQRWQLRDAPAGRQALDRWLVSLHVCAFV
jgi:hypothetical protein